MSTVQNTVKVYPSAQAYFNTYAIWPWGGGGEFEVNYAPHVILKQFSEDRAMRHGMMANAFLKQASGPTELVSKTRELVSQLKEKKFGQIDSIMAKLGGIVVPFERPGVIECRVRHWFGILTEKEHFYGPIIQQRIKKDDLLTKKFAALRKQGDFEQIDHILTGAFNVFDDMIMRGFFPHDNMPTNYCLIDGAVLVYDVGAVWEIDKKVKAVLTNDELRAQYMRQNIWVWETFIRGNLHEGKSKEMDEIVRRFKTKFSVLNEARHVQRLFKGHGVKSTPSPVPKVFPLTVSES